MYFSKAPTQKHRDVVSIYATCAIYAVVYFLATAPTVDRAWAEDGLVTSTSEVGEWGPVLDWGIQAKHMILLPTGEVLVWSTGDNTRVWDPATNTFTPTPFPAGDLHCAAQTTLADGRIMVAGGQNQETHIGIDVNALFDPFTKTWTEGALMNKARWYGSLLTLHDGRVVVTTGDDENKQRVLEPEIYDPDTDSWDILSEASRGDSLYTFLYQLPDGQIFQAGPLERTWFLDINGEGTWTEGPRNSFGAGAYSVSSAMIRPGIIMNTGGNDPAVANAGIIDMNANEPAWRDIAPMNFPRRRHDLTILPDGSVIVVGGTRFADDDAGAVFEAEIFDPNTETWSVMAPMSEPRMYHSSTVLLPDGRVVAGGGEGGARRKHAEIFSPPYLFKGPRPTITSAPSLIGYADDFVIDTPEAEDIASVAMIRGAGATHTYDQSQRYIPLQFESDGEHLHVDSPPDAFTAAPGYYMLFIVNSAGVPAVAPFVKLASDADLIPGRISGSVIDVTSGAPIAGASVSYSGNSTTTDTEGNFAFSDVTAGTHTLIASAAGFAAVTQAVSVLGNETTVVSFTLSNAGSVTGTVFDEESGLPVEGINVSTLDGTIAVVTDSNGQYTIEAIAAGEQRLKATGVIFETLEKTVTVTAGAVATLDFSLHHGHTVIEGEVWEAGTLNPITTATVSFSGGSTTVDEVGFYIFDHVDPGTYEVTASAPGYESITDVGIVLTGFETTLDFILQPKPTRVHGTVIDATTRLPIPFAKVTCHDQETTTDAAGGYELLDLPVGEHIVAANAFGYVGSIESVVVEPRSEIAIDFVLAANTADVAQAVLNPAHDSRVRNESPDKSYGQEAELRAGHLEIGTIYRSFLQFPEINFETTPVSATLRLHVTEGSPSAGELFVVTDHFDEDEITYTNAPACGGTPIATLGSVTAGEWIELDITNAVVGTSAHVFCIENTHTNSARYSSDEGPNPPELVIGLGPACSSDSDCNDSVFCNGAETCHLVEGCRQGAAPTCDDGVACTLDSCDLTADACVNEAAHLTCDDGVFCNGIEVCDAEFGCVAGESIACDDGVACTVDLCDATNDICTHAASDTACDDGLFCTGIETCDATAGCLAGTPPVCDDGINCTTDTCDPATDTCLAAANHSSCDDGIFCNGDEFCDLSSGCSDGPVRSCNDGIECTSDACDAATDACVHETNNNFCDDDVFCNGAETCDGATGCVAGSPPSCDDDVACTADACDVAVDACTHTAKDERCEDGLFCNGTETCDPVADCQPATVEGCSEEHSCDEVFDVCLATAATPALAELRTGGVTASDIVSTDEAISAVDGDLYLAVISTKKHRPITSVSGLGLEWLEFLVQCSGRQQTGISIWLAQGTPTESGLVTATIKKTPKAAVISVLRYTDIANDALGNIVAANSNGEFGGCVDGSDARSWAVDLQIENPRSLAFVAVAVRQRAHDALGFTELAHLQAGSGGEAAGLVLGETLVESPGNITLGGSVQGRLDWSVVAIELAGRENETASPELPPVPTPSENEITEQKRVLGKILFWEEQLSRDDSVACGTCHQPAAGGADARLAAHPGFDSIFDTEDDVTGSPGVSLADFANTPVEDAIFGFETQVTERSAPTMIGAQYASELFLDGSAGPIFSDPETGEVLVAADAALENQALHPILNPVEMSHQGRQWAAVAAKLQTANPLAKAAALPGDMGQPVVDGMSYPDLFAAAFGDPDITPARIAFSLATYQRTLIADQTPWDAFMAGDETALTPNQQLGWEIFKESLCVSCHVPPLFTDNAFHNIGVRPSHEDLGRQRVTGLLEDAGKFRTPTLRNAALKASFMHNGSLSSMGQVADFYLEGRGAQFLDNIDPLMALIDIPIDDQLPLLDFLENGLTDPRVEAEEFPFDRPLLSGASAAE